MSTAPTTTGALRLKSCLASSLIVALACLAYRYAPFSFHQRQFSEVYGLGDFRFTAGQYFFWAACAYIVALAIFHAIERTGQASKALRTLRVAVGFLRAPVQAWRIGLVADDRLAVLTSLLKAFFAPLMAVTLMTFCHGAIANAAALFAADTQVGESGLLRGRSFWVVLQLVLFVDVLVFTAGYLIELPALDNQIRSVDRTLYGWAAALACYPPFNVVTGTILGSTMSDFPQFDDATIHAVLNALVLALMAFYAWASVALGWKGSNLTHRGIVARGPYALIRHPAYISKNLAWWIGSLPVFQQAFAMSWLSGLLSILSMFCWSALYLLRALTEEDHLKSVDGDYAAYASRVRYRFVPGLA